VRFLEFFSFAATLLGTWVASGGFGGVGGCLALQAGNCPEVLLHCSCMHSQGPKQQQRAEVTAGTYCPNVVCTAAGLLTGGYKFSATADVQAALRWVGRWPAGRRADRHTGTDFKRGVRLRVCLPLAPPRCPTPFCLFACLPRVRLNLQPHLSHVADQHAGGRGAAGAADCCGRCDAGGR
jgi:hypothetical protein